jgi:hypothetical protein
MRYFILFFLFTAFGVAVSAQTAAKIRLQNSAPGKVTVIRGKTRAVVDLSKSVAGCAFSAAATKKRYKDCAASPAEFKLIDATVKDNLTYLVISSEASGNCNVCGQCGATDAFGLIWIKLDRSLRVLDKKDVPIDFCLMNVELISDIVDFNEETQVSTLKLAFEDDILMVEFEKREFIEDKNDYEFSHLEYSRKTPEKGFVIKTEKREKSSLPDR